jgi:hypothetical protein
MAVKYVKDFDFSKGTAACNYAKGGSAKKPAGMMIVIGVGKPKGPMRKAEGGSISDSDRRMMEQMAGDANAYTEAQRIMGQGSITDAERRAMMGQGSITDAERRAMKAAAAKKSPPAKKGSPYIPGTNVKAGDLYTKEELERLERGYKKGGKVAKVMHEFGEGKLHSGSKEGPKVTSRKQAVAIALSEAGKSKKAKGGMAHPDEAMDKALIKKMVKPGVLKKAMGGPAMGSMGKANPYAMGPGGREYESAMDKQSNQMPVPQRGGQQVANPAERAIATDTARYQSAMNDFMSAQKRTPPGGSQAAPMIVGGKGKGNPYAMGPGGREYETGQSQAAIRQAVNAQRAAPAPMPAPTRAAPAMGAPGRGLPSPTRPPAGLMKMAKGGMSEIQSPLQRMSRAKGVPVASEMPMIESKSSGPKSIGVNAKRPGGPNVGKIRAAMARAASKAVPENAPSMMKKGGKVK